MLQCMHFWELHSRILLIEGKIISAQVTIRHYHSIDFGYPELRCQR